MYFISITPFTKVGYAHNPVSRTYCCKTDLNSCFLFVFYSNKLLKPSAMFAAIDTAARLRCEIKPNTSCFGNDADK
jgi:hypothetical protein